MGSNGDGAMTAETIYQSFRHAYFPVARSADLERPQLATLLGEDLVVYRTEDTGEAVVASNRCPHRGAGLHLGEVHGSTIACPYHGWRWRGSDGRCTLIPALGERGVVPTKARIQVYPSKEKWGLVWACLGEPIGTFPYVDAVEEGDWLIGNGTPIPVNVGIGAATENVRDMSHFPFVHRSTFGPAAELIPPLNVQLDGTEVRMEHVWKANPDADPRMWPTDVLWQYHIVAPSFLSITFDHGDDGTHILLNAVRPVSPEESVIYWVECLEKDFKLGSVDEWVAFEEDIYAEDIPVLESVRPREVPFVESDVIEHSTRADKYTLAYRQAVVEFARRVEAAKAAGETPGAHAALGDASRA